jgi:hypothetical protein
MSRTLSLVSLVLLAACGIDDLAPVERESITCRLELRRIGDAQRRLQPGRRSSIEVELRDSCMGGVAGETVYFAFMGPTAGTVLTFNEVTTIEGGLGATAVVAGPVAEEIVVHALGPVGSGSVDFTIIVEPQVPACADHCGNGILDCGEEELDCGGDCPPCIDPCAGHCGNQRLDCGEIQVDCGGTCADCPDPCDGHCQNGRLDCGEEEIDCGGECEACIDPCANHCQNGALDCGEAGPDCGGGCGACPPVECLSATIGSPALYCEPDARGSGSINIPSNATHLTLSWVCDDYCDLQVGSFIHDEGVHILIQGGQTTTVSVADVGGPGIQPVDIHVFNYPAPHCGDMNLLTWVGGTLTIKGYCVAQ